MDIVLWIVQILLAVTFAGAGLNHATRRDRPRPGMEWMLAVPKPMLTTIGVLEILGAVGLVVPLATGVVPWLTPLAALALTVLMGLAAIFHLRRGEPRNAVANVVLGVATLVVAIGRSGLLS